MSTPTIFTRIIRREIPAAIVHEDRHTIAFMDAGQVNPGHVIVATKEELAHLNEIADGPAFKMKNDPRITRIGRFIRKTSIDELPQLFNVLHGEMSLVGPRPLPMDESAACDRWQRRRLDVTPGLTCIWQVKGRSRVTFAEWMRMDVNYIGGRSLWRDVRILAETVPAVLLRRGAK